MIIQNTFYNNVLSFQLFWVDYPSAKSDCNQFEKVESMHSQSNIQEDYN